jgi:hypothetical protein
MKNELGGFLVPLELAIAIMERIEQNNPIIVGQKLHTISQAKQALAAQRAALIEARKILRRMR